MKGDYLYKLALANLALMCVGWVGPATAADRFENARKQMVDEVVVGAGVKDERVIESMLATPRPRIHSAGVPTPGVL